MEKSKSVVGFWFVVGIALGITLGMAIGSITVGLPMGVAASFLVARITERLVYGWSRLVK